MQRTKHKKAELEQERIDLLNTLPSWTFNPQATRWQEMHDTVRHWLKMQQASLRGHDRLVYPSKSSLTPFDRKAGQWLANQRCELSKGMSAERAAMVQDLPGWSVFAKKAAPPPSAQRAKGLEPPELPGSQLRIVVESG